MQERARVEFIVGGHFRLVESLFVDAFGEVFRAVDRRDGGAVRVRALHPGTHVALGAPAAVLALARGGSAVRDAHLNVLRDVIVDRDRWHLVSDPCEGDSIADHIARDGALDELTATSIIRDAARALAAIHEVGGVHGRLDPTRVIVGPDGVKVCDLGLGMLLGDESEDWRTTLRDADDPSVAFLSPEQARGDGAPSAASDVWSLAAILYFALTGTTPYQATSRAAQAKGNAPASFDALPGVRPRLGALIGRCLATEPERRPSLRELMEGLAPRGSGRTHHRIAAGVVGAAVVLLAVALARPRATHAVPIASPIAAARTAEATALAAAPPKTPAPAPVPTPVEEMTLEEVDVPVVAPSASATAAKPRPQTPRKVPKDPYYGVTSAGF